MLEIGLLHLQLLHFLIKVESVTSHVLLQRLHTAHVEHKTHCSRFTGTYGPFTLLLGLLKQQLECLQFHDTEEMEIEMADF